MTGPACRCLADYRSQFKTGSPAWVESWGVHPGGATCMLPAGHAGPHEWTSDDEVLISLPPEADP